MSGRRDSLSPPEKTGTVDPGAHELESSDSDDHFSDAQSAPSRESQAASPIPKLRVEKISDEPSYGEVPGTDAYKMREGDAEPDEIAVIPDESDKASGESRSQSGTPSGGVIPTTVVEETADTEGSETHPEKHHRSDPPPDLVLKADGNLEMGKDASETPISPPLKSPSTGRTRRRSSIVPKSPGLASPTSRNVGLAAPGDEEEDEDFGDDFDDFEEGGEDDDFGDFDDGFEEPASAPAAAPAAPPSVQPLSIPIPDFEGLDADEILSVTQPYLNALYSTPDDDDSIPTLPPLPRDVNPVFLTPRSASLWSQLVAPPPLQPPDWIRSRIRRLFLVSLGVPVDLDEILPASKQKKLVLPSLAVPARRDSPRTSSDSRRSGVSRLKQAAANNGSSTSVDSQGKPREPSSSGGKGGKRRGPPPAPELDLVAGRQLCQTTDEALDGMTDAELGAHVARLEAMEGTAREVLEYWTKRTDEKIGDREAFEGVIENLVKHARKVRK